MSQLMLGRLKEWGGRLFPSRKNDQSLDFKSNGVLTLGVEIELQIIDPNTLNLRPEAEKLLRDTPAFTKLKQELFLSTVEIVTDKCQNVHQVEQDLSESFDRIIPMGHKYDVVFATTGCHPFSRYADSALASSPRYDDMIDRNQWLVRRQNVYGLHVHIGMQSGDDCIRFNNFLLNFTPHVLALSASSPFWQASDTGLASCRPTMYEALPTAGQPYQVQSWREFETLVQTLKKCDAIRSLKDLWWDMRPSVTYGTLEIRICDGPATLDEALAVTAFLHLLAHWFQNNADWIDRVPPPMRWVARENKWRAIRHGLDAKLVKTLEGDTVTLRDDILMWLERLGPYAATLGYGRYMDTLRMLCARGNSSTRQRAVYATRQSLEDVVAFNVREFAARKPQWDVLDKTKAA